MVDTVMDRVRRVVGRTSNGHKSTALLTPPQTIARLFKAS